jgi:hypothetical protein
MKLNQRILEYWTKQLEYTRDDSYPNSCRNFSITVSKTNAGKPAQSAPLYEVTSDGTVVHSSITVRGIARRFEG